MFTRRALASSAALVVMTFGVVAAAEAGTVTVVRDTGANGFSGAGGAGEFGVSAISGYVAPPQGAGVQVAGYVFQSFCLEKNEDVDSNTQYFYETATGAINGGITGGNPDPLNDATAWLYQQFWKGTLSWTDSSNVVHYYDYTLGTNRKNSASALQRAIWAIEGELTVNQLSGAARDIYDTAIAAAGTGTGNIGNVRVMNLYTLTTNQAGDVVRTEIQSQLIMAPLPSAAFLGLGLMSAVGAVGAIRRRRRSELS